MVVPSARTADRVPSLGLATATAAADGPGEAIGACCGPSAPAATIPTSSTTGTATPTRRSVRRAGDRGLVGVGSTIIGCQWYVPGRRPDDRRARLLCTDGADRGARGRHRAELLAGDDAGAAGPPRRAAPGHGRCRGRRWRVHRPVGGAPVRGARRERRAARGRAPGLGRLDAQRRDDPPGLQDAAQRADQAARPGARRAAVPRVDRRVRARGGAVRGPDRRRLRPVRACRPRLGTGARGGLRGRGGAHADRRHAGARPRPRAAPRGDRLGRVLRRPRRRAEWGTAPGQAHRGAGDARGGGRSHAHRGRPGAPRPAPGGRAVRRRDVARRDPAPGTSSSPRTATPAA